MFRFRRSQALLWSGALLILAVLIIEVLDDQSRINQFDVLVLRQFAEWRSPLLTIIFSNLTALGSTTLIFLHTLVAFALLLSTRDKAGAYQLGAASLGSSILTQATKGFVDRPRPTAIPALAEAFGSSYPSGHALSAAAMYVTITILACRHLPQLRQRRMLRAMAAVIIIAIAVSRLYLGVHYATDIVSGMLLGTGWALLLARAFAAR
jgi:undecaprenyl-diphosphatase